MSETPIIDVDSVVDKLSLGIGKDRAQQIVRECLIETRLRDIGSPDELQKFAERLVARGGFICIVGRSLLVESIMMRRKDRA